MERTFVMVKPDGVKRGLIGEIIKSIEQKGFQLKAIKMLKMDYALAGKHYQEHVEKPFYPELAAFITSGPVVTMIWAGEDVIKEVRVLTGATNPKEAADGTIRNRFGTSTRHNVIHASDSPDSAEREEALYFSKQEILD